MKSKAHKTLVRIYGSRKAKKFNEFLEGKFEKIYLCDKLSELLISGFVWTDTAPHTKMHKMRSKDRSYFQSFCYQMECQNFWYKLYDKAIRLESA